MNCFKRGLYLHLSDFLLGEEKINQIDQRANIHSKLVENDSSKKSRVGDSNHSCDVEEDCVAEDDATTFVENNNSKDIFTDASPDTPSDDDNTNVIEATSMINTERENKVENILRKQSRDAEAQTKARESRDSFRCRGCGVESNRQRFEEEVRGYEFTADHVGQRSMSDTFKVCLFFRGGSRIPCRRGGATNKFAIFSQKLHEMKKILVSREGALRGHPLGSGTVFFFRNTFSL